MALYDVQHTVPYRSIQPIHHTAFDYFSNNNRKHTTFDQAGYLDWIWKGSFFLGGTSLSRMSSSAAAPTVKVDKDAVEVIIHPLVLLSVADHYNRIAKDSQNRVVGVLLGNRSRGKIDVSNSFAVPFEEDLNNPSVWFLDHNFLYTMYWMFKKVNSNEEIVGFYSSGPKVKENDLKVYMRRYYA